MKPPFIRHGFRNGTIKAEEVLDNRSLFVYVIGDHVNLNRKQANYSVSIPELNYYENIIYIFT